MRLHNPILLFVIFNLLLFQSFGQGKEDFSKKLFDIKMKYQKINQYKSYKVITIDDAEEFTGHALDNGGSLTGYFRSDTLVKIVEWLGLSNKVIQREYYLDSGKLFFVYFKESFYKYNDSTGSFDYSKLELKNTGRYYFQKEKLFDTILSDKEKKLTKEKDAKEFVENIKKYVALLKKRFK